MANVRRLVELSMVPPLAKEVAAQIDAGGSAKPQIAALTALSGTVGTANDAMTAVAAAVAPADNTAAGLASLASVNTAITAINNNLADLQAKVNAIITALKA